MVISSVPVVSRFVLHHHLHSIDRIFTSFFVRGKRRRIVVRIHLLASNCSADTLHLLCARTSRSGATARARRRSGFSVYNSICSTIYISKKPQSQTISSRLRGRTTIAAEPREENAGASSGRCFLSSKGI